MTSDYAAILRRDLMSFIERSFYELNPQTELQRAPHLELIAARLEACRRGDIRRLIVNLPPRQLKSHCASVYWAFNPAYAQVQSEHVFPTGWVEVAKDGVAPEKAAEKGVKRVTEIFAKYPIA